MDYSVLKSKLKSAKQVLITTHRSPDGDAIGSSLGLAGFLKKAGLNVAVLVPDAFPSFLNWMDGVEGIHVFEEYPHEAVALINASDVIFALDYNKFDRVGEMGQYLTESNALKVMIDHHIDPASGFDFVLSDTKASSTCELIFRFAENMAHLQHLDQSIGEALYAGIMTDTGSFRFSSTSADTHRIVASLMDAGLKPDRVHQLIFDTNTFDRLQLIGYALTKKLIFNAEKGISIISLSLSEKNRFHYKKGDTEGLVNYGLSIAGASMAVFVSEELGATKFSFRSKAEIDVNQFARNYFNGGGHKNAAGGKLDMKLKEALRYLEDVIEKNWN